MLRPDGHLIAYVRIPPIYGARERLGRWSTNVVVRYVHTRHLCNQPGADSPLSVMGRLARATQAPTLNDYRVTTGMSPQKGSVLSASSRSALIYNPGSQRRPLQDLV